MKIESSQTTDLNTKQPHGGVMRELVFATEPGTVCVRLGQPKTIKQSMTPWAGFSLLTVGHIICLMEIVITWPWFDGIVAYSRFCENYPCD
jgi:hypothetical protein